MDDKKKQSEKQQAHNFDAVEESFLEEFFGDTLEVASGTECTGLVPAAPINESQADSYGELYSVPVVPHKRQRRDFRNQNK